MLCARDEGESPFCNCKSRPGGPKEGGVAPRKEEALNFSNETPDISINPKVPKMTPLTLK